MLLPVLAAMLFYARTGRSIFFVFCKGARNLKLLMMQRNVRQSCGEGEKTLVLYEKI